MTLRDVVAKHYRPRERLEFTKRHRSEYRAFLQRPQAERDAYRLFYGHMPFGIHEAVRGETLYVTMLRDPVERVISQYYNIALNKAERENSDAKPLEEWAKHPLHANAMTRLLAGWRPDADDPAGVYDSAHPLPADAVEIALHNLRTHFAVVGMTEAFDESLLLMKKAFGWGSMAYVRKNIGQRRRKLDRTTPEIRALIAEHAHMDMALYAAAKDMYAEKVRAYGPALAADFAALQQEKARYTRLWELTAPVHQNRYVRKIARRLGWR